MYLRTLGWNTFFQEHWDARSRTNVFPARITEEQRGAYRIAFETGELPAEVTGRFRNTAAHRADFPAVGDWVAASLVACESKALIHEVLPRRTRLSRKEAGLRAIEQILVANVDTVLIVTSLNSDLNIRRIERYLSTVWEGGATPVIVLSKADLTSDASTIAGQVELSTPGVAVHVVSGRTGEGLDALTPYFTEGHTVVFVGSSGVGKSTIINRILCAEVQSTREVREADERGRHATTYRRLFPTRAGGVLIDTPGLRELQLWESAGLGDTFEDIGRLAEACRFRDCGHVSEPHCAVQHAIADGTLDPERLENFRRLSRELEYLSHRRDLAAQSEQRKRWKQITKAMRERNKNRH